MHSQAAILPMMATRNYISKIISTSPTAYWPMNESAGIVANNLGTLGAGANGAYTGATLNQIAAPGGTVAPRFDAVNDFMNCYTAALAAAFNPQLFSMAVWFRTFAGAADRFVAKIGAIGPTDRTAIISTSNTTSDFYMRYVGGSTQKDSNVYDATTGVWYHAAITLSKAADEMKAYVNGSQLGATITGIPTWTVAIHSANCLVGANTTAGDLPFNGYICHFVLWPRVLTPGEVLALYNGGL